MWKLLNVDPYKSALPGYCLRKRNSFETDRQLQKKKFLQCSLSFELPALIHGIPLRAGPRDQL